MLFDKRFFIEQAAVLRALGYGETLPDPETEQRLADACAHLEESATPRWSYRRMELAWPPALPQVSLVLSGAHIARHLEGCDECVLLALTLGSAADEQIRAAQAQDMALAVLMDAAASTLIEQYADEAERILRAEAEPKQRYLTSRFSPGYGDFPIEVQPALVRVLDGPRAIGLNVTQGGVLLPQKSITALLGVVSHPVWGQLAGCEGCALAANCVRKNGGTRCGERTV